MRATDPDEAIGRNVKRLRVKCGRTIDDVVKAMQKAGYRWNATTQSNIERGARPLRASEVLPLLRCMGYDSDAEEHIMQVYATPTRNKLDDLAGEMSLTTAKFEDEWCRFIRFRKRMLSILDAESSKDELTISEHDQFDLQPRHIWGLPVPVPDSWEQVSPIIDAGKGMISAMEQTSLADESLRTNGFDSLIE